jgi:hypothetical protein
VPAARPSRPLLTTTEVGRLARPPVSSETVLREIGDGRLQAITVGGYRLVDPDEAARRPRGWRRCAPRTYPAAHRAAGPVVLTKITFPRERPGEVRIRVYPGGNLRSPKLIAGACVFNGRAWDYTLWSRPGQHSEGDETGDVRTLTELRGQLEKRIGSQGNWWH